MTNMKTQVKRFTALTLVWVIVTSCFVSSFSFFVNAEEIVTETATQKIEDFVVSVVSGAVNKGSAAAPDYYWNLEDEIKYQIDYNTSGEGELAAESVQFIIPKHIIKNRNGEYADIFDIAVPDVSEVSNDDAENEFVFTERQNDILVYNRIGISAAQKGSVQFSYKPSQSTFNYEDMSVTDSVNVQLNINKSESERLHTEAVVPEVRIDTSAVIRSVKKELSGTYDTWNNSWGNAAELGIDHPNDYIYLIWQISTKVKATQPYTLHYYDTVTGDFGDASAVGISNNVSTSYSTDMNSRVLRKTEPDTIYNFVLTKHLKSTYEPHETYKIKNRINVEVIPIDGKDGKTSASTTAEYTYSQPKPDYPIGVFNYWKYNNYSYYNNDRIYNSNIMNYQLDEFKNHFINDIQDRMIYKLVMVGFPYPWTLEDGFLPPDVDHYGVKKVTYVMTDDVFFFRDTVTAYHDYDTMDTGYVVPPGTEQLDADDFEITNVSYSLNIKDAEWDTTALHFVQVNPAFKSGDDVYFYAKFGKDTTFRPVGIFHLDQRKGEILSDKVTKLSVNNITFAPDAQCVGYKIVISNAYYNTLLNVYPSCRIKHSERIHRLINGAYASGEKRAWLTNIANVKIYKSEDEASANDGNKIFDKSEYARNYIIGYEKESQIEKTNTFMRNDKTKRTVTLGWNVEVDEHYMTQDGLKYVPQESGMFYDLLPLGGDLIPSTVTVRANGNTLRDSQYDVSTIVNYRNSGRTLLIVKVKESTSEKYTLMYSTLHSWESLIDYGDTVRNSVAYETGNDRIAGGYPDNGGGIRDSSFMRDLDVNTNERKFLYAEQSRLVKILLAVNSGLFKQVKSDSDSGFAKSAIVYQNQQYIYRLRYETDFLTKSKNMILFDNLDNYENPNTGVTSQWQGTLESVDVSQPVSKGVAPVIYLSELNVDTSDPDNRNLSNRNIWKPKNQFGDISKARSIAVDMSKDKNGNDFVLDAGKSVVVLLYMRSPSAEPDIELPQDQIAAHAYNDTSISSRLVSIVSGSYYEDKLIEWGYDTVELRIMCDIPILKVDETDHTTPVSGIYFRLQGISDYGTNVDIELESDNEGRLTFKNIEKGHYELIESKGSRDYRRIVEASDVEITSDGKVLINGAELGDGARYVINDPPRIHADIMFNKRDSVNKRKPVAGVKYKLSGRSEYGNNILMYAQSDENGTVIFEDIELGRNYKLVEVSTVPGYILDNTEYSVVVDDNGNFGITPSTMEKNGSLTLYNEPLHSFTLQKIDFTTGKALGGAKFNLSGVSDYGTEFNVTGTANETTGRLSFNDLEKGTYVLQEIEQPDGYFIDDTKRIVTITEDGEITISGLEKNETGNFIVDNKKNGTVTITKLWVDKKANNDRDVPVIHLSSERKKSQATFRPTINRYYSALYPYAVSQNGFTNVSQIKRFMQLPESGVQPDPDRVFRMDDNKTDLPIYGWFDSRNGTLYWWSDAQEVFMPKNSESFFRGMNNLTVVDFSGISTSRVKNMSYMFYDCSALTTLDISGFDTSKVTDMRYMFYGCSGLTALNVNDFDTSNVTDMSYMFSGCSALTSLSVSGFDTSKVTDMSSMFYNCQELTTLNVSGFDTSNVTDMSSMFYNCQKLTTLNISGFDTANVTDMSNMFYYCSGLTTLDVSGFDTSKVTDMRYMFYNCRSLTTLNVSGFDTANVTDMSFMFYYCQKLTTLDVSGFDTANVTDMSDMFYYCYGLTTLNVSGFDTANVTNMSSMFHYCSGLTTLDVSGFDTSKVTDMGGMFYYCYGLTTLNVSGFDTSKVTNMRYMFYYCYGLTTLDVSGFDTSKVTDMSYMFYNCNKLTTLNLSGFDTSNVTDMRYMFINCYKLTTLNLSSFDTTNVTDMSHMFFGCSALTLLSVSGFDTSNVTDMSDMFYDCRSLTTLDVSGFDTSKVTNMNDMFGNCQKLTTLNLSGFDTSKVTNMRSMFYNCQKLTTLDVSGFDTSNVTDMRYMFYYCSGLTTLNVSGFDTSKVTSMSSMFSGCSGLTTLDVSGFDTSKVTSMSSMFSRCSGLTTLNVSGFVTSKVTSMSSMFSSCSGLTTLDVTGFNTSKVTYMNNMFSGCSGLTTLDVTGFDTAKVTDMNNMFYNCSGLTTLDVSGFDTSNVTNIGSMFNKCSGLTALDVSGFDTSKVTSMGYMFYNCSGLTALDVSGFDTSKVTSMSYMFYNCSGLTALDVSGFDTSNVTSMSYMFYNCSGLTALDVSGFGTANVTYMSYMFYNCSGLTILDVSGFDTSNVTETRNMFHNCNKLKTIIANSWNNNSRISSDNMFLNCTRLVGGNGTVYSVSKIDLSYARVDTGETPGYFTAPSQPIINDVCLTELKNLIQNKKSILTEFKPYVGSQESVQQLIDTGTAVRIDDGTTAHSAYAWLDGTTIYWWSDAETVYLPESCKQMFSNCSNMVNADLSGLNTSRVTDMSYMFYYCSGLTSLDLSGFDTSKVKNMIRMFYYCRNLKTIIANTWYHGNTDNSEDMFRGCKSLVGGNGTVYPESLITWNIGNGHYVTEDITPSYATNRQYAQIDESGTPGYFTAPPQSLQINAVYLTGLGNYILNNRSTVTEFKPYDGSQESVQQLIDAGTAVRIDNGTTFYYAYAWLDRTTIYWWSDAETVYLTGNSSGLFNGCSSIVTIDLSGIDTSNVTNMSSMFSGCSGLTTLDLSGFDTSKVTNMSSMFSGCSSLTTLDLSSFVTSMVRNMGSMFSGCSGLTPLDVSGFDTLRVTNMSSMFSGCSGLTTLDVSGFNTANVTNMSYMFYNCTKLTALDVSGFDTSDVTNMSSMFYNCQKLTTLDVSGFDTSKVTNMSYMFYNCQKLTTLDVSGFDTAKVTNMSYMFRDCSGLTALDVSGFDTSKVTDINNMFCNCSGLTTLDVSGFVTSKVTNMSYMFSGCSGLTTLDVSGFDTSKVTSMSYMFNNCQKLTALDVSDFVTANVTNMSYMFSGCSGLTTLDISGFGTANVTNMSYMFNGCSKLTTIYVLEGLWKTDNVTSGNNMFTGCTAICGEKGTTYNSSHTDKTYARIDAPENSKPGYLTQKEIESDETDEQTESDEGVHYITDMTLPDGLRMADGSSTGGAKCVLNKDADTNTWTYTFTGINDTVEYYVWEDDLEGYTGTATKYHPGIVEEGAFTITNTNPDSPKYGALKLKKTVNAEEGTLDESDLVRKFTFTVTLTDENNKPVTGSSFYGNTPFMNGVAVIKLSASDGETVFTDIPENWHYSITETAEEGYESTVASGNAKGTIEADTIKSVVFNNTRKHEETIPDVSFSIKKLVTGNVIDPNEQYTFFVDLSGLRAKGTYSYVCGDGSSKEFTATQSGSAYIELDLKKDEVATFTVPENTNYTVTEQAGQYTSSYQIVDAAGKGLINNSSAYNTIENTTLSTETETADAGEMIEITFTNVKNVTQNLTLSKKLLNASDDNIDKFDFTLNITGLTSGTILQSSIGRLVVTDGQITIEFSLASGETVEIYDIPVGAVYEVIEAESDYQASYEIKHNNSVVYHGSNQAPNHSLSTGERSIQVGADPEVIFTNRKIACDITITKRIDMTYGNLLEYEYRTQGFEFEVELNGLSGSQLKYNEIMTELFDKDTTGSVKKTLAEVMGLNEQEGQQLVDSAVFSITLHHGESFKIRNLPYGATCKVTERASEDYYASYIVKSNTEAELQARPGSNEAKNTALSLNAAERIDTNDTDIEFVFTNRYEFKPYELPAAGTHDDRLKIVFLIFGMLTFAMTYYCVNRRKHKKSSTK